MKLFHSMFYVALGALFTSSLQSESIEFLEPPVLSDLTIDEKVVCTRPMREGKFNISVEEKGDKVLVHCYGHGGSGCTTSFGSVRRAIELYQEQFPDRKDEPVRIIGGGIIGLTMAIELTLKGFQVTGITARELYDIPSWKNAGYFALVSVQTDSEEQENLNKIGMATFKEYKMIHEGVHPYIRSECIRYMPVYCSKDTDAGVEDLERKGLIPPREMVTVDFGNGVRHEHFSKFMTYFMDTTNIMVQLWEKVNALGISIDERELRSFDELEESVVFNCSGLGAKQLNEDDKMIAVRGHLLNLNSSSGSEHMNYMIYSKFKGDENNTGYVYMFPKCLQVTENNHVGKEVYGTLGGTFIPNTDLMTEEELNELDSHEFKKLADRNSLFFWGKPFEAAE
jgi:D-amino-acid oxidase